MHCQAVIRGKFGRQCVNCQIRLRRDPSLHPIRDTCQLTAPGIALPLRCKRPGRALEAHHVVDELNRDTQPPRRLGVSVALLDKPHGTFT